MPFDLQSTDRDMVSCRTIDETHKIAHDWLNCWSSGIVEESKSHVFMSYHVIHNDVHKMREELEAHFDSHPESTFFPFERETFLYAAEFGSATCLEFALMHGDNEYKNLEGIIILCIIHGHHECLEAALRFDNRRKVGNRRFGWIKEFGWVNPFVYTWYYTSRDIRVLRNRVLCYRLLFEALGADGYTRHFRSAKKYLQYYYNCDEHFSHYVKYVLWEIFRIHARFRMILNYWIKTTGEHTCAPGNRGRTRHFEEFADDFIGHESPSAVCPH